MILITGAARLSSRHLREIESLGRRVVFMQYEHEPLPVSPGEVEAVICNSLFRYHPVESFTRLKLVQATSAGLERMPLDLLDAKRIMTVPARGVYSPAIAEFVILMILQIYKRSSVMLARQKTREWEKERGLRELTRTEACIVGCGSIGKETAARLQAFGVKILPVYSGTPAALVDDMLRQADIVVLSLPLSKGTERFMDARRLSLMKNDSTLINISRGEVIDESALITLLDNGKFLGVGLDVFENEPLSQDSPLWDYERVIVTPHNSFVSDKSADRLTSLFIQTITEYL